MIVVLLMALLLMFELLGSNREPSLYQVMMVGEGRLEAVHVKVTSSTMLAKVSEGESSNITMSARI